MVGLAEMASTTTAVLPSMTATCVASAGTISNSTQMGKRKLVYLGGLNSFGGLKAHNNLSSLGLPVCSEQGFGKIVRSLRSRARAKEKSGGGALSSTCNAASEIFKIAAIMNALVLIGVAVGFVLLRVEAWLEESE